MLYVQPPSQPEDLLPVRERLYLASQATTPATSGPDWPPSCQATLTLTPTQRCLTPKPPASHHSLPTAPHQTTPYPSLPSTPPLPVTLPQVLELIVNDSRATGRPTVGRLDVPLARVARQGMAPTWLPLTPVNPGQKPEGELLLEMSYTPFEDESDSESDSTTATYA